LALRDRKETKAIRVIKGTPALKEFPEQKETKAIRAAKVFPG
jgi:hypothetical protein